MSAIGKLLPPSSTQAWEYAIAAGMSDELPVPYAQLMDPYETPAQWLPWLAGHYAVDLWYEDWPEARKREIIAQYAGVSVVYPGEALPELKGSHIGVLRYLSFVDADVIDFISYPARFVMGLSAPSFTPVGHPPFKARYLVKVMLDKPVNAFVLGLSALGHGAVRNVDLTPVRRVKEAMRIAKAPSTEYLVTAAWRRQITFADEILIADGRPIGGFIDRTHI
ncbi:phage tail protein I [Rhizobium sp. YJ-22]|uniref:phage tail protein I n=1 Tax=Rhizobium sp. YJ-22 TaxID=3037556 RepID=UPI00241219F0|nr:phage tail protein I [Rhizobium sp. YJ-22]MDG3580420.1 phage tail protein I [Rhizobium sp. YJ-22]